MAIKPRKELKSTPCNRSYTNSLTILRRNSGLKAISHWNSDHPRTDVQIESFSTLSNRTVHNALQKHSIRHGFSFFGHNFFIWMSFHSLFYGFSLHFADDRMPNDYSKHKLGKVFPLYVFYPLHNVRPFRKNSYKLTRIILALQ